MDSALTAVLHRGTGTPKAFTLAAIFAVNVTVLP